MNVFSQTQEVLDLLEIDVFNVNYEKVAKLTGIPLGLYQRIFSYICNISMTEYIRRRKLTVSAEKLLSGEKNITDVAFDCGYENCSSFTRAFKDYFGVSPVKISFGIFKLKAFYPLSFSEKDTYYVLKGVKVMAELIKIEYENTEDMLLIGVSNKDYGVAGRELWDVYFNQHFDDRLTELISYQIDMEDCIGLGYYVPSDNASVDTYIVGKMFEIGTSIPKGMTGIIIKGGTIARAQIRANNFNNILDNAYLLMSDMVSKNGYELKYNDFYWIEFYTVSRYCKAIESGAKQVVCDWIMPCIKLED